MASQVRVFGIASMAAAAMLLLSTTAGSVPLAKPDVTAEPAAAAFFPLPASPISYPDMTKTQVSALAVVPASATTLGAMLSTTGKRAELHNASLTATQNPLAAKRSQGHQEGLFDSVAIPFKRLSALTRLAPSYREIREMPPLRCSPTGCVAAASPETTKVSATGSSPRDRLNLVNAAINRSIRYSQDKETYGVMDRWATPSETLSRLQGDCEDFAILKMAALHSHGFDLQDMSLVVIFDQKRRFYHAVLSVELGGRNYILDNLTDQIRLDSQLPDYVPLYSIRNGKGFLHGSRDKSKAIAAAALGDIAPGEGLPLNDG